MLSRSRNFEFRPQQQQMAVAVARALSKRRAPGRRGRHGRGQEPGLPGRRRSCIAMAKKKKAVISHPHDQSAGTAHRKGPADARAGPAGGFQLHDAQGPRQLPLHPPPAQGDAAVRQPVHFLRSRGTAAHLRVVQDHQRRQPLGFRGRAGPEGLGAGLLRARALLAQDLRLPVRVRQGSTRSVSSSARASAFSAVGRAGAEPHAVFHAAGRPGGGNRRAASCSGTISSSSTRRTRWSTSPPSTSA